MPTLSGRRLAAPEHHDTCFLWAIAGALALLVSYLPAFFPMRIIMAETRFSGGTVIEMAFPVLISEQHYAQAHHPLNEELVGVRLMVAPVEGGGTGWGWLLRSLRHLPSEPHLLSYALCLLLPVLAAVSLLVFVGIARFAPKGLPEAMIPITINLAALAIPALALAWCHQFDFSARLLKMEQAALTPRAGFWLALLSSALLVVAAARFRRETRRDIVTWWALVFAIALSIWLLTRFRPQPFLEIWRFVSDGIVVTLRITATAFGFILLVSLLGGLGRISRSRIIYGIASLYVEIVRGIPLLVQLLFIWFALPQVFDTVGEVLISASPALVDAGQWLVDLRLNPFTAAVLGLTVCYGAYGSEIFRAGISSIHHGQMEAARSLGMNYIQAMRHVILPQAVRVILPPIGNEFVALLKDSTLVSVLAVSDLTRRGREYMARTFLSFDTWALVALCYLVLTLFSSRVVEYIEARSRFGRQG